MDKNKEIVRDKSAVFLLVVFSLVISASGCETTKGIAKGTCSIAKDFVYTVADTTGGAVKDTKNFWQAILKADDWIKKNLW